MYKILLVLCLSFGCVFGTGITLKSLQDRLVILEQQERAAIANFTAHGLDFVVINVEGNTEVFRKALTKIPPAAYGSISESIEGFSGYLNHPLDYSPLKENLVKPEALYYAAMKFVDGDTGNATVIKEHVMDIITAEIAIIKKLETSNLVEKNRKLSELVNHDKLLTIRDFFWLEDEVNEGIAQLLIKRKEPEASQLQNMLNTFLEINARINRAIPIDSAIRLRQYYDNAPEHYRQYKSLKAILDQK